MYAQVAIKPNPLLRNGAYGIVMRGVQKCTRGCSSLRGRNKLPLCCIKLDTATDPACGSGGFLIGALDYVYKQIEHDRDNENDIIENKKDYASECVFGIDYDKTIAKVAKAYMLIWGDGRSNIAACDGLNSNNWDDDVLAKFTVGHGKEKKLRQFDIIVSNPPFAGDISSDDTLSQYELAFKIDKNGSRKRLNKIGKEKTVH